jgi:hypothetical protein
VSKCVESPSLDHPRHQVGAASIARATGSTR